MQHLSNWCIHRIFPIQGSTFWAQENYSNNCLCNSPNAYEKSPLTLSLTFQIHTRNPVCNIDVNIKSKVLMRVQLLFVHTEVKGNKKISQDIDFDTTYHGESGPKHGTMQLVTRMYQYQFCTKCSVGVISLLDATRYKVSLRQTFCLSDLF